MLKCPSPLVGLAAAAGGACHVGSGLCSAASRQATAEAAANPEGTRKPELCGSPKEQLACSSRS